MANNPIKYSDFISPDDSINNLIKQLQEASAGYTNTLSIIKEEATAIYHVLEQVRRFNTVGNQNIVRNAAADVDRLTKAERELRFARSDNAKAIETMKRELKDVILAMKEEVTLGDRTITGNKIKTASYNELAAQYAQNKRLINDMTTAERQQAEVTHGLITDTKNIYEQMKNLQEATGKTSLNVGNYSTAFKGVIRLFRSWQMIVFYVISNIGKLDKVMRAMIPVYDQWRFMQESTTKANKEAVEETGKLYAKYVQLKAQWSLMGQNVQAQRQFIRNHVSDLKDMGVSMHGYIDAEKFFNASTPAFVRNLMQRCKALAAEKIATDLAKKSLDKKVQSQNYLDDAAKIKQTKAPSQMGSFSMFGGAMGDADEKYVGRQVKNLQNLSKKALDEAKKYDEEAKKYALLGGTSKNELEKINVMKSGDFSRADKDAEKKKKEQEKADAKRIKDAEKQALALEKAEERALTAKIKSENEAFANEQANALKVFELEEHLQIEKDKFKLQQEADKYQHLLDMHKKYATKMTNVEIKQAKEIIKLAKQKMENISGQQDAARLKKEFDLSQKYAKDEFDASKHTSTQKRIFALEQEREKYEKMLELNKQFNIKISESDEKQIMSTIDKISKEIEKARSESGKSKDIFDLLHITDPEDPDSQKKKEALREMGQFYLQQAQSMVDSEVQVAKSKLDAAHKSVDAAQQALEDEIAFKKQGYASDVEEKQKQLELAKKTEADAIKETKKAQKEKLALDIIDQTSNMITAVTKIAATYPFPLSLAMSAGMLAAFVATKIKAAQAIQKSSYGEGGVEMLEGGSHYSGNDISLGIDSKGRERRAEGGEYLAIINKRSSKHYGNLIPSIIDSLNKKTFENSFLGQYSTSGNGSSFPSMSELGSIDGAVQDIRSRKQVYHNKTGNVVITYKNLMQTVHDS